jgi:hypothetical protein
MNPSKRKVSDLMEKVLNVARCDDFGAATPIQNELNVKNMEIVALKAQIADLEAQLLAVKPE